MWPFRSKPPTLADCICEAVIADMEDYPGEWKSRYSRVLERGEISVENGTDCLPARIALFEHGVAEINAVDVPRRYVKRLRTAAEAIRTGRQGKFLAAVQMTCGKKINDDGHTAI